MDARTKTRGAAIRCRMVMWAMLFFWGVGAADSGAKSLYVAPGGSDSVSYDGNTIDKPWASPRQAWFNARAGDTVYFRGGTYTISSEIDTKSSGYDGTAGSPITFRNYETEDVTFVSTLGSAKVFDIERNYNVVKGINFRGGGIFFHVGYNTTATHFTISHCTAEMTDGGDNVAFVKLSVRAENALMQHCTVRGPGFDVHQNTAGVILFRTPGARILHCEFSNAPIGIFYKHANLVNTPQVEIAYNYIHDTANRYSILTNTNYAYIHDNVIGVTNANFRVNSENGGDGGDNNKIWYNTVFGAQLLLSDDADGARNNDIRGNVFVKDIPIHRYESMAHNSVMDENLHPTGTIVIENRVNYTLDAWRSHTGGSANSKLIGSTSSDFVGGSSPSSLDGFALSDSSAGYMAIRRDVDGDGTAESASMGAYIPMVGPQDDGDDPTDPTDPDPPTTDVPVPRVDSLEVAQEVAGDDTIFMDDFESSSLSSDYSDYNAGDNTALSITSDQGFGGSSKSLVAKWFSAGQVSAGSVSYFFGRNPAGSKSRSSEDFNEIYWRFYIKLSKGWQGNAKKLTRASVFSASDWRQAMIAHVWHGNELALGTDPKTFVSGSTVTSTTYNDQNNGTWLGAVSGTTQLYETDNADHWICIESRVKLNSSGNSDGEQDLWIDGELEIHQTGLNWIGSWREYGINMISLGNYWNGGSPRPQQRYLDNLVIATSRIGMAGSPVNPAIYKTAFDYAGHTQSGFEGQVSTTASETGIVWAGGVTGTGNTLVVNSSAGDFSGTLAGQSSLAQCTTYYARVRQADEGGNLSGWSPWKMFVTLEAPWGGGEVGPLEVN
ncbi:hypothetical protein SAMN05216233_102341 [Desulfoluna spongiiphila]|uniref:Right handed beta helix region n=2 Tax=Desulfoluna spongiiphila TaxID=419481 RepID=A0A1G5C2M4_9BACT|nr:hypothetical protein SAMN05216233_102341 [Desulfoluna spongiiphila]VVS94077.1 pectin lyase fold [Desulfoluna spongiiphila]